MAALTTPTSWPSTTGARRTGKRTTVYPVVEYLCRRSLRDHARPQPPARRRRRRCSSAWRRAGGSTTPTAGAWSTATSSPPTCCSATTAACASPTSGSPALPRRHGLSRPGDLGHGPVRLAGAGPGPRRRREERRLLPRPDPGRGGHRPVPFAADTTVATLMNTVDKLMPVAAELGPLASVLERAGRPTRRSASRPPSWAGPDPAAESLPCPAPPACLPPAASPGELETRPPGHGPRPHRGIPVPAATAEYRPPPARLAANAAGGQLADDVHGQRVEPAAEEAAGGPPTRRANGVYLTRH